MFKKLSRNVQWLIILVLIALVASIGASLVQNSFFGVKVDKISFETERGELAGYLYMPDGVDDNNPAPAVVLTHGYLNNSEMQEIGAIELSRRGYVVLAFDMYDHGDSEWETPGAFSFFSRSVYDAVTYMYDQDYVLKDALGNGMIGVSGHSMGGFSSTYAVMFDEFDFLGGQGYRKIAAALPVGSDYRYVFGADESIYGPRSAGHIAAHYDQFFFDNSADPVGSVIYKDFLTDDVGLSFLGKTLADEPEAGVFYDKDDGQRVIYTPDETHPQNTWSLETGKYTIEFFEEAFDFQLAKAGLDPLEDYGITTGTTGQVWWLKEAFTGIALVSLFMTIIPLFGLLTTLPFFKKVYANEVPEEHVHVPLDKTRFSLKVVVIAITVALSVFYLTRLMNRDGLDNLAKAMYYIMGGAGLVSIAVWVGVALNKEGNIEKAQKVTLGALVVAFIALAFRWLLTNTDIVTNSIYWGAPSVNTIVYWAMGSAGLILLGIAIATPVINAGEDQSNPYGVKAGWIQVGVSFVTALAMVTVVLLFVAIIGWVFLTDFRFYTYAVQIFNARQFVAALRYIPLFFIYYFAAGITVFVNTKNMKGWQGDLLAAFLLAGPVVIFLCIQYYVLYHTGVAFYPTFDLSAILAVGLVPTLAFAGILMRRMGQKTGNIWTAVFFSTIFFTLITLANTAVYVISIA